MTLMMKSIWYDTKELIDKIASNAQENKFARYPSPTNAFKKVDVN